MPRKLKTYLTSLGFFDLAVAAPSMKGALEAWGSKTNLFVQGFAKQTDDPAIIAATMAKPGSVLRRPVGSDRAFSAHAELPRNLPDGHVAEGPAKAGSTSKASPARQIDNQASVASPREQKRRDNQRQKAEAAQEKETERREQPIAQAERAFAEACRNHEAKVQDIARAQAELDDRAEAEDRGWAKLKEQLQTALRQAGD